MWAQRIVRQALARQVSRRSYHAPGDQYKLATYNDLPTPQGSWQTNFDANQRKYNAQLVLGVGVLVGTIVFGKAVGYLEFHSDIPEKPADIASYK